MYQSFSSLRNKLWFECNPKLGSGEEKERRSDKLSPSRKLSLKELACGLSGVWGLSFCLGKSTISPSDMVDVLWTKKECPASLYAFFFFLYLVFVDLGQPWFL